MVRKRSPAERGAAILRRLNEPRERKARRKAKPVFVTRGDVEQIFREAAKTR